MNVTKKTASTAQAEQWLDTQESLHAIQRLLAPASPLASGHLFGDTTPETLGVYVAARGNLQFATVGDWVVRGGNTIAIVSDAVFKMLYAQAAPVVTALSDDVPLVRHEIDIRATSIQPTHPRALADLDDNIDQTFDRR